MRSLTTSKMRETESIASPSELTNEAHRDQLLHAPLSKRPWSTCSFSFDMSAVRHREGRPGRCRTSSRGTRDAEVGYDPTPIFPIPMTATMGILLRTGKMRGWGKNVYALHTPCSLPHPRRAVRSGSSEPSQFPVDSPSSASRCSGTVRVAGQGSKSAPPSAMIISQPV